MEATSFKNAFPKRNQDDSIAVDENGLMWFVTEDSNLEMPFAAEEILSYPTSVFSAEYDGVIYHLSTDANLLREPLNTLSQNCASDTPVIENCHNVGNSFNIDIQSPQKENEEFDWTDAATKLYLDLYESLKNSYKIKKYLFSKIARVMSAAPYFYKVTEVQVANKDKTCQRQMKKYISNTGPKSSGRSRKTVPHEDRLIDVYGKNLGKKHNVAPTYVLTQGNETTQEDILVSAATANGKLGESASSSSQASVGHSSTQSNSSIVSSNASASTSSETSQPLNKKVKRESKTAASLEALKNSISNQVSKMDVRNTTLKKLVDATEQKN